MDSNVEKIKDKISIVDLVGQYVQLRRAGRTYMARCPFHKEKTASFHVSPERGTYKCFGCGEGGDIFTFVEKMDGIDFPTALRQLAEKAGVVLEHQHLQKPQDKQKEEVLHEVCEEATTFFESKLATRTDVQDYLRSRGVQEETIKTWRLGYAPASWEELSKHLLQSGFSKDDIVDAGFAVRSEKKPGEIFDRFRGRIIFPIMDTTGRAVGVSGRFFEKVQGSREGDEPAKYVNSPETLLFKKSKILYGFDRAKTAIRKLDCILLVEGQFDLILSHQSGLPFTVALSGTALTPEHLSLLGRLSKRLVLALDNDSAGLRSGLKSALMAIQAGFDVKIPSFHEAKDPADVAKDNPELLKAAVRTSKTAVEFFLEALRPQAKDERAYKHLVETQVLPLITVMSSKIEQAHFIRLVSERLGVPEDAVRAEVAKRPILREDTVPETTVSNEAVARLQQTPLQNVVALLLFGTTANAETRKVLEAQLGKERLQEIETSCIGQEERLRFEFDILGEDTERIVGALLQTVERRALAEKMQEVYQALRSGTSGKESELLKELAMLKRREQELRG